MARTVTVIRRVRSLQWPHHIWQWAGHHAVPRTGRLYRRPGRPTPPPEQIERVCQDPGRRYPVNKDRQPDPGTQKCA